MSLVRFKLKGFDLKVLDSFLKKLTQACKNAMIKFSVVPLPSNKKMFTVLTSPFIYSSARDQFFLIGHSRLVVLHMKQGQFGDVFKDLKMPDSVQIQLIGQDS